MRIRVGSLPGAGTSASPTVSGLSCPPQPCLHATVNQETRASTLVPTGPVPSDKGEDVPPPPLSVPTPWCPSAAQGPYFSGSLSSKTMSGQSPDAS